MRAWRFVLAAFFPAIALPHSRSRAQTPPPPAAPPMALAPDSVSSARSLCDYADAPKTLSEKCTISGSQTDCASDR